MTIIFYSIIEVLSCLFFHMSYMKKQNKKVFIFIVWQMLFFIVAFRDLTVGRDYQTYYFAMKRVAENKMLSYDYTWLSGGFRLLIKVVSILGVSPSKVPFVVSGILAAGTLYFFIKAFDELSIKPTISLFLFFCFCYYFQMMNQFRQMFAIAVVLYSYKYIDKSFIKYTLLIALGGIVHSSAFVLLPMYFIVRLKINRKLLIFYFISALSIGIMYPYVRKLLAYTPYKYYLGWEYYDIGATSASIFNLIVRIILLIVCLLVKNDVIAMNSKNYILYHFAIICTIIQVLAVYVQLFTRVTTYFYEFYILLLPYVFCAIEKKFTKNSRLYIKTAISITLVLYQIVYFSSQSNSGLYANYRFIFS